MGVHCFIVRVRQHSLSKEYPVTRSEWTWTELIHSLTKKNLMICKILHHGQKCTHFFTNTTTAKTDLRRYADVLLGADDQSVPEVWTGSDTL